MIRFVCLLSIVLSTVFIGTPRIWAQIKLSEIRTDQPSADVNEFFELRGLSGASLDGITYLVIGEQSGTGSGGGIEMALDLTGNSIPSDGYFLATEDSFQNGSGEVFSGITADLSLSGNAFNFENSDNVTHLIVQGFNGARGDDIDLNDDGVLFPNDLNDPNVWSSVLDAVGFVENASVPPVGTEYVYGAALGFEDIGPDAGLVPGILFRDETQMDVWQIGVFALADPNTIDDTPGTHNVGAPTEPCDFDNDTFCNLADINLLFEQGDLVAGIPGGAPYDLVVDGTLNQSDVTEWLSVAATHNGYETPYLRGDTDGLDAISGEVRDVDITDFNALAQNFNSMGMDVALGNWDQGNFDGDGDIDITDFNALAANFSPGGYGLGDGGQAVPEPAGASLVSIALLLSVTWSLFRRMR